MAEMAQAARRSFDLATELPIRFFIAEVGAQRSLVLILVDHIAADGWSIGILASELLHLYDAAIAGRAAALPPSVLLNCRLVSPGTSRAWLAASLDRELAFWRQRLASLPTMRLPTDRRAHRSPASPARRSASP